MEPALAAVSDADFAASFFRRYIYGHESFDYAAALQQANIKLQPVDGNKAWAGVLSFVADNNLRLKSNTVVNTPLYNAGIDMDDLLISMDGKTLATVSDIDAVLKAHKPGDTIPVHYEHRGNRVHNTIKLSANPWIQLIRQDDGASSKQKTFVQDWLGSKSRQVR